jgi:hypothetical protein
MRPVLYAVVSFLLAGCMSPVSTPDQAPVAWTQFGQGDDPPLIARALIGDGASCPAITIDGVTTTMTERRDNRAAMFGRMCEARRPLGQAMRVRIAYGDRVLLDQNVTRDPATIAVVGDTGCRVTSFYDQVCGDPAKWPFAQVADAAAAKAPSLILHLGDYYYRETPCKGSAIDCVKSPYGDRPETWRAEFFTPARNLLPKAPWVFVRGNHEDCMRGGYGWNYYDGDKPAGRKSEACAQVSEESIVRLAGLTLVNVDSAHADDPYAVKAINNKWKSIADTVVSKVEGTSGPVFVMTHDAAYFVCPEKCDKDAIANIGGVRTIGEKLRASGRRTIMLAGHVHVFQVLDGSAGLTEVIVGNGGAGLDKFPAVVPPPAGRYSFPDWRRAGADWKTIVGNGTVSAETQVWGAFGFGILTPSTLDLTIYDPAGRAQLACTLAEVGPGQRCR